MVKFKEKQNNEEAFSQGLNIQERPKEYDHSFTNLMQLTLGEGFLSFGGTKFIDRLFEGINLNGKKILDVGSGLGGPARYLAEKYDADIIGIDIEPDVVEQANRLKSKAPLKGKLSFSLIEKDTLPFENGSFDLIFGSLSWLHIDNKPLFFKKIYALLKEGGYLLSSDWMHASPDYSQDLKQFLTIDGLKYYLTTREDYEHALEEAGFKNILSENVSIWMIQEFHTVYHHHFGELGEKIKKAYGEEIYYTILHSWLLQRLVFEKGELQSYIVRAYKVA